MRDKVARVRDLMTKKVATLNRNDSLDMAEGLMVMGRFRHLPIVDDEGAVVGMVSNRDFFRSALAFSLGYGERGRESMLRIMKIKEVMREPVVTVAPDATLAEAARVMMQNKIGSLPVVEERALVGILTETDLLRHMISSSSK